MTVTRLGMQGARVRCSVSCGVLASEVEQARCNGRQSAIGPIALGKASSAVQQLFGSKRQVQDLTYDAAVEAMSADGDKVAKAAMAAAFVAVAPAMARAAEQVVRPHCEGAE